MFENLNKAIEEKLVAIVNPKKEAIKRPHNRLWIALIAFNLIFFPLDVATGITVGYATLWIYGIFVFGAGFGTMIIHEALYSNPYARFWQKAISVFGFATSIIVTLIIGLSAIGLNLIWQGYDRQIAGAVMAGGAFVTLFFHGLLIASYYFMDSGFQNKTRATQALADSDRMVTQVAMAKIITEKINEVKADLIETMKNDSGAMSAAMGRVTGEDWSVSKPYYTVKNNGNHPEPVREPAGNPQTGRGRE